MPRGSCAALALALAIALTVSSAGRARAHGGPPTFEAIVVDPTDPNRLLAATNFGLLASADGGVSWAWICPQAVDLRFDVEDPSIAIAGDGSGLVGDIAGLWRADSAWCAWAHPSLLVVPATRVGAVEVGAGPSVYFGTSGDGALNAISSSADYGASWSAARGPDDAGWYESLAVARSDPARLYAVQNLPPIDARPDLPWQIVLLRSDDSGMSWVPTVVEHLVHEWRLFLLDVDPTDPDRILARLQNLYAGEGEPLLLSEDGGGTWREVLRMVAIQDASFSADGTTAWAGGPVDGLWRSDDAGRTFAAVYSAHVRCTLVRGSELWICADDFSDGFAIGRSRDRGETFEPVARLRSITGILACPTGTSVATECPAERATLDAVFASAPGGDAGVPDLDAGDASVAVDAALDPSRAAPACACRASSAHAGPAWACSALVASALVASVVRARARRWRCAARYSSPWS